ncbi:MAG TPA: hypothetical protein PLF81_10190 [Candidatus Anammoximicrobium sp.]|nr:hypothetical protein [Candidatus Anammoximicrobium sp.]
MQRQAASIIRIGCLVGILTGFAVEPACGYTLVDWIRTWPAYAPGAAPAPAVPVTVPAYAAPAPSCGSRPSSCGTSAPAPVVPGPAVTLPAAPTGAGVSYAQPVSPVPPVAPVAPVAVPAPQVRYRTTWVQVPTTSYRPVVSYDPATGWPTTTMQPCTTYSWQVRREPTVGGGLWEPFARLFAPWSAPQAQPVGSYPAAPVTAPGWPAVGVPVTPSYPPPTTAAPAATALPGLPAPPAATPGAPYASPAPLSPGWTPSAAPSLPTTPAAPTGAGSPATATPADQPPRLSPNEAQGVQNLQPIPETRSYPPSNNDSSLLAPPALLGPPKTPAAPQSAPVNVTPVPDPDAGRKQVPAAPSLYDPNGRTANLLPLSTVWPTAPILWPQSRPSVSENPTVTASGLSKPAATREAPEADGWQAVRP